MAADEVVVMALKFSLVCLTCRVALGLGRVVAMRDDGTEVPPYFEGFRNRWDGRWVQGSELLACVQRFLVLHLGHELGTVDSDAIIDALEPFEIDQEPFRWLDDAEELLDTDWQVPDVEDSFEWPAARALAARLSRLARGG